MADNLKTIGRSILTRIIPKTLHSSLRLWMLNDWPDGRLRAIDQFTADPVTVLAPHPDDEVIGPGGAVRRHVLAGANVGVVIVTDGRWGGYDPDKTLVARRQEESRQAARIMGTRDPIFVNGPDNALQEDPQIVTSVARILAEQKPSVIYLPALTDNHRDHWATNRILHATLPLLPDSIKTRLIIRGYEVWSPALANCYVDITTVADTKRQAINAFPSQTNIDDYAGAILGLNKYRSLRGQHGRGYAEAFMEMSVPEFRKLFAAASLRVK